MQILWCQCSSYILVMVLHLRIFFQSNPDIFFFVGGVMYCYFCSSVYTKGNDSNQYVTYIIVLSTLWGKGGGALNGYM